MSPKIETQKELTAENQAVGSFRGASGGNRTRTAFSGQGIFLLLWLSPPVGLGVREFVVRTIPSPWGNAL